MKILSICNFKGGVGKTTSSINLAKAISMLDYSVLLVDSDPQSTLTAYFGLSESGFSLHSVYEGKMSINQCVCRAEYGLSVIPSSEDLSLSEATLAVNVKPKMLKSKLRGLEEKPDFVVIDAPPGMGWLIVNIIFASDYIFCPLIPEPMPVDGLNKFTDKVNELSEEFELDKKVDGIFLTNSNKSRKITNQIKGLLEDKLFQSEIRTDVRLAEAFLKQKTIFDYAPNSNGAKDYLELAKEVIQYVS